MVKTISLKKIIELPKFKMKKSERVYDKEWHMYFPNEQARQDFIKAIEEAEKEIERGDVYTLEEVDEYFFNKYGI